MKCDELTAYKGDVYIPVYGSISDAEVYLKEKVDEAIAELKAENERISKIAMGNVEELRKAHEKELRSTRRALWIAHAYKAKFKRWWLHLALDYEASMIRPNTKTINRIREKIGNCEKSERKCREKAEEYK